MFSTSEDPPFPDHCPNLSNHSSWSAIAQCSDLSKLPAAIIPQHRTQNGQKGYPIIPSANHGAGICTPTFARTKSPSRVGKYTSTMEHMGISNLIFPPKKNGHRKNIVCYPYFPTNPHGAFFIEMTQMHSKCIQMRRKYAINPSWRPPFLIGKPWKIHNVLVAFPMISMVIVQSKLL